MYTAASDVLAGTANERARTQHNAQRGEVNEHAQFCSFLIGCRLSAAVPVADLPDVRDETDRTVGEPPAAAAKGLDVLEEKEEEEETELQKQLLRQNEEIEKQKKVRRETCGID